MRRIRHAKELTQENVAERAELHPNYISSVERGERNISIRNIERIALALGVTMAELVTEPGEAVSEPAQQALSVTRLPVDGKAPEASTISGTESIPTQGDVP